MTFRSLRVPLLAVLLPITVLGATSEPESQFTLEVQTPPVTIDAHPGAGTEVGIKGYGLRAQPAGAPDLPEKIYRVAIPPGVTPRLEVVAVSEELRKGIRPRPVANVLTDLYDELDVESPDVSVANLPKVTRHEIREEKGQIYAGAKIYPEKVAWLGETGILRDQRYVEVHVVPVRFDPKINGLRIAKGLKIIVHFDGDTLARTAPAADPRFEDIYRSAFANYAQGTTFRLGALAPKPEAAAVSASALATGPIRRIKIRQNGVVRLDFARMSATTGFLSANLSTWKLMNRGVEVPIEVNDVNGNDLMDSGDWIQFYGQALDDEPKAALNTDLPGTPIDVFEARDFTDENVYFLTTETGVAHSRMPSRPSAPTNTRTPPNDFLAVAHLETDSPTGYKPLGGNDPWYWMPSNSNPVDGSLQPSRTETVGLPGLASPTADAEVLVKLRGVTEDSANAPDHHSRITLKTGGGTSLSVDNDNNTFDGRTIYTHDFVYHGTGAGLTDPAQVTIDALTVSPAAPGYLNQFILDWIEVRYRRLFQAASDALTFDYPDGDAEFIVSGLTSAAPEVYEITGRVGATGVVDAVRLTGGTVSGAGPFSIRFRVDNAPGVQDGTPRRFVVFGGGAVASLGDPDFTADTVSDLKNNANQADMIVIADPTVLGVVSTPTLNQLLAYHATKGITSKIAMIQDVYDEFGDGLPGPGAIRNFLRWVMSTSPGEGWADPKPAYVMILGDGSYDYKAGEANGNFVPTQIMFLDDPSFGYYASDNNLAAVIGTDQLPDLIVGRLVARTDSEDNLMLQKIRSYQQAAPAGNWKQHVVFASDRGKRDGSGVIDLGECDDFEETNTNAEAFMKTPPYNVKRLRYCTDFCDRSHPEQACDDATMRTSIRFSVNGQDGFDGAGIFQYVGHGNYDLWSDDDYWDNREPPAHLPTPDPETLTNGSKLPWLLAHGCLIGGFQRTESRSMGENWLKRSGGGSVAVFGPSGLTFNFATNAVSDTVFQDVYGFKKSRVIGDPVMDSWSTLCGQGSTPACQMYVLMGDPAMDLVFPSVAPPTSPAASSSASNQVTITWTASATPSVAYHVFKTTSLAVPSYTEVTCTPLTTTSCVENGLVNSSSAYYYVIATDAAGFESRWSNFNSDCAISGPDCVRGTALNPNPPAVPSGFTLTDAESGGRLNVAWIPNADPDLAFYTIHYGTAAGNYTVHLNNGKISSANINGLANGTRYFMAISATNTSNKTSANSAELSAVPTFVRGLRAPQVVSDLTLAKSGSDVVLSWGAVTTTIYGKPATISKYEVYRGTTLGFVPGPASLISGPGQTGTNFTDAGALASGTSYFYVVHAVDTLGTGGGLGNQLPMGVDLLTAAKSPTPGNVVLTWPAVTTAFSPTDTPGAPLVIDHYEIYGRTTAFTRADIQSNAVPLIGTTSGTTIDLAPPAGVQYLSVVAVDARGNKSPF